MCPISSQVAGTQQIAEAKAQDLVRGMDVAVEACGAECDSAALITLIAEACRSRRRLADVPFIVCEAEQSSVCGRHFARTRRLRRVVTRCFVVLAWWC